MTQLYHDTTVTKYICIYSSRYIVFKHELYKINYICPFFTYRNGNSTRSNQIQAHTQIYIHTHFSDTTYLFINIARDRWIHLTQISGKERQDFKVKLILC